MKTKTPKAKTFYMFLSNDSKTFNFNNKIKVGETYEFPAEKPYLPYDIAYGGFTDIMKAKGFLVAKEPLSLYQIGDARTAPYLKRLFKVEVDGKCSSRYISAYMKIKVVEEIEQKEIENLMLECHTRFKDKEIKTLEKLKKEGYIGYPSRNPLFQYWMLEYIKLSDEFIINNMNDLDCYKVVKTQSPSKETIKALFHKLPMPDCLAEFSNIDNDFMLENLDNIINTLKNDNLPYPGSDKTKEKFIKRFEPVIGIDKINEMYSIIREKWDIYYKKCDERDALRKAEKEANKL